MRSISSLLNPYFANLFSKLLTNLTLSAEVCNNEASIDFLDFSVFICFLSSTYNSGLSQGLRISKIDLKISTFSVSSASACSAAQFSRIGSFRTSRKLENPPTARRTFHNRLPSGPPRLFLFLQAFFGFLLVTSCRSHIKCLLSQHPYSLMRLQRLGSTGQKVDYIFFYNLQFRV